MQFAGILLGFMIAIGFGLGTPPSDEPQPRGVDVGFGIPSDGTVTAELKGSASLQADATGGEQALPR